MKPSERTRLNEIHKQWLEACTEEDHRLTKWELGFVNDLTEQMDKGHSLSERQVEILERIYSEKTS